MDCCCHKGKKFKVMDGDTEVATLECTGNGINLQFSEAVKKKHSECCPKE